MDESATATAAGAAEAEPVDAEVVDEHTEQPSHPEPSTTQGTALARPVATREVLMPLDPDQVVQGMQAYQQLLPRLLSDSDWQNAGQGKKFVKKSGWRKIARAFNLSLEIVRETVERNEEGHPERAHVVVRAIAPNGAFQDGDGYCAADESRFADDRGRQKLENDLRATATTRAKNRAIADLVGMGEVSAEEVTSGGQQHEVDDRLAPVVNGQKIGTTRALVFLFDDDAKVAEEAWRELVQLGGVNGIAKVVSDALIAVAKRIRDRAPAPDQEEAPPPAEGGTPAPGTAEDTAENREKWCRCVNPVEGPDGKYDDECPIKGHSVPF